MTLVEQRDGEVISVRAACDALDVSRASLYRRHRSPSPPPRARGPAPSPRRLDDTERQHILDTLHRPEFADQPPTEVYATLLGRGVYLASIRTMYRVLAEAGETSERRNQRPPQAYAKPSLTATAPNQVWTWDITKLATTSKGVFLLAYVIIDLFSRYVVGWLLARKECQHLAAQLFAETIARHGIAPGLQVHADRGSAMKSDTLAQLLASLGASRSFSRPHVSDDNAFSEAQFKTLKYQPDYPGQFDSELHGRAWLQDFFGWHNDEHHHASLALFTPADVFYGRVETVRAVRQAALDAAYQAHPERFSHGPPRVPMPPTAVHINPLVAGAFSVAPATTGSPAEASRILVDADEALALRAPYGHAADPGGPDLPTRTHHLSTPRFPVTQPQHVAGPARTESRLQ
jgi:transposase InsO family protein